MLITHHHADHQGGVAALLQQHGPVDVFGPAAESITGLTRPLQGGEILSFTAIESEIRVLPVPGHTLGHLAYQAGTRLFCGDTLFGAGCGRLFEGSPAEMANSLALLAAMPEDTEVFCAHEYTEMNLRFARVVEPGNEAVVARQIAAAATRARGESTVPSTMALEKATNPFLRCRSRRWLMRHGNAVVRLATRWRSLRQSGPGVTNSDDDRWPASGFGRSFGRWLFSFLDRFHVAPGMTQGIEYLGRIERLDDKPCSAVLD